MMQHIFNTLAVMSLAVLTSFIDSVGLNTHAILSIILTLIIFKLLALIKMLRQTNEKLIDYLQTKQD